MSLHTKLMDVQQELQGTLTFDAKNPHFKNSYITLGKLLSIVLPALQSRGVLLMQPLEATGTGPAITTAFIDVDSEPREVIEKTTPLILEKETPQGVGSAITYTRRYAILSALGLVADEDDDAESATTHKDERNYAQTDGSGTAARF